MGFLDVIQVHGILPNHKFSRCQLHKRIPFTFYPYSPISLAKITKDHSNFEKQATLNVIMNLFKVNTRYFTRYTQ